MSANSNSEETNASTLEVINKSKELNEILHRRNPQLSPDSKRIVNNLHDTILRTREFREQKEIERKNAAIIAEQKSFAYEAEMEKQRKLAARQFREVFTSKKLIAENTAYLTER